MDRAYITLDRGGNEQDQIAEKSVKRALRTQCFAFCGSSNVCRLAQQGRILTAKHLCTKAHGRVDLRLPETPVGAVRVPQTLQERLRAVVQILSQFGQGPLGHFIDSELAGKITTNSDKFDQSFDFSDLVGVQN